MEWEIKKTEEIHKSPHLHVAKDIVDLDGKESDYIYTKSHGSVIVIPIKHQPDGTFNFVCIEEYRHPVRERVIGFPGGGREPGEPSKEAAVRELKEETGYSAQDIKFLYTFFTSPAKTNNKVMVFVCSVEGDPGEVSLDEGEKFADMKVVELTADELHQRIRNNEITDGGMLGALSVLLLQSKKSLEYFN